jgi:hypothetical protein
MSDFLRFARREADQVLERRDASHRQSRRQHLPFARYGSCLCATALRNSLYIASVNHSPMPLRR